MRKGDNPQKEVITKSNNYNHLVVVPIYIPFLIDYYSDSFKVLRASLLSLKKTSQKGTFISVVDNGSCKEVRDFLTTQLESDFINELIHTKNIGKINAILKGVAGHMMPLVTITDADILFKTNWQQETINIFNEFPKAGVVGLIPQFKMFTTYSANLIFDRFWDSNLKFSQVDDPEEMKNFYKSIGWEDDYNKDYLKNHLTISSNNCSAILGSGHAVATYKSEIFSEIKHKPSIYKLGGDSETKTLDSSVLLLDGWRLTTSKNYAFHMGNILEPWMQKELNGLIKSESSVISYGTNYALRNKPISNLVKSVLFKKILKIEFFYRMFLKFKGLPVSMIKTY